MASTVQATTIGKSKERGIYDIYLEDKSNFSTQAGNNATTMWTVAGGFSDDGVYNEKYAGGNGDFGGGNGIAHMQFEVFDRIGEKPQPPQYYDQEYR